MSRNLCEDWNSIFFAPLCLIELLHKVLTQRTGLQLSIPESLLSSDVCPSSFSSPDMTNHKSLPLAQTCPIPDLYLWPRHGQSQISTSSPDYSPELQSHVFQKSPRCSSLNSLLFVMFTSHTSPILIRRKIFIQFWSTFSSFIFLIVVSLCSFFFFIWFEILLLHRDPNLLFIISKPYKI